MIITWIATLRDINSNLFIGFHRSYPSWSIAITRKRLARASKFRKNNPSEAPNPWIMTMVGAFSLLSNVTVFMNLGSSLDDPNHLTFDPGGAEPMLTCSWTYPVL